MPSSPQPVADLLAALQEALAALGVRWYLFGAQAAVLYGVVRLSADVDVTVDLGKRSATDLVAALASAGFELRVPDAAGFAEATRVLPFVHRASRMPLDVVLAGPGLEEQFFAGAQERLVGDVRVPVVCAEDLVAMKVLAGRPRDLDDVAAIARVRRDDLDLDKIRVTLRLLERALDRSDLIDELERVVTAARRLPPDPRA
ncbi:MAG: nucleotidyl transferase AbiEii/AbiGii toxin family protein [Candidatus Rokuibacteriota bacterium]